MVINSNKPKRAIKDSSKATKKQEEEGLQLLIDTNIFEQVDKDHIGLTLEFRMKLITQEAMTEEAVTEIIISILIMKHGTLTKKQMKLPIAYVITSLKMLDYFADLAVCMAQKETVKSE